MTFDNFIKTVKNFNPELNLTNYQATWIAYKLLDKFSKENLTESTFKKLYSIVA